MFVERGATKAKPTVHEKNKTRSLFHFHFQAHGAVKRSALATNSQIGMQLAQNLVRRYHGYLLP